MPQPFPAGWAGVMTLPRELALDDRGRVINRPAKAYEPLRMPPHTEKEFTLYAGECLPLTANGRQLEMEFVVERGEGAFELGIAASPAETEVSLIRWYPRMGKVWLDTTRSSLSNEVVTGVQEISIPDADEERFPLRVLLDGSVIEIWVDDAFSLSGRSYPTVDGSQAVYMKAGKENIRMSHLSIWKLSSVWKEN